MQQATAKSTVELNAVVYPPCMICGEPWSKHGTCGGYQPSRPIEDHGTVFFRSKDWFANSLFAIERLLRELRRARLKRL